MNVYWAPLSWPYGEVCRTQSAVEQRRCCVQGGDEVRGPLTEDELQRLRQSVATYVADKSPEAALRPGSSMMFINAAFQALKDLARGATAPCKAGSTHVSAAPSPVPPAPGSVSGRGSGPPPSSTGDAATGTTVDQVGDGTSKGVLALRDENGRLRLQVQQRDNEINILVSMLKKRETTIAAAAAAAGPSGAAAAPVGAAGSANAEACSPAAGTDSAAGTGVACGQADAAAGVPEKPVNKLLLDLNALSDRNRAFELFRKSYRRNAAIESSKAVRSRPFCCRLCFLLAMHRCTRFVLWQALRALKFWPRLVARTVCWLRLQRLSGAGAEGEVYSSQGAWISGKRAAVCDGIAEATDRAAATAAGCRGHRGRWHRGLASGWGGPGW